MWPWAIAAPFAFFLLILILDVLERMIVSPVERAAKITALLAQASPEEVEGTVAKMLAPIAPRRSRAS